MSDLDDARQELNDFIAELRAEAAAAPPMTPAVAIDSLRDLTACHCDSAWTDRGWHRSDCCSDWREEVDVLAAALAAKT